MALSGTQGMFAYETELQPLGERDGYLSEVVRVMEGEFTHPLSDRPKIVDVCVGLYTLARARPNANQDFIDAVRSDESAIFPADLFGDLIEIANEIADELAASGRSGGISMVEMHGRPKVHAEADLVRRRARQDALGNAAELGATPRRRAKKANDGSAATLGRQWNLTGNYPPVHESSCLTSAHLSNHRPDGGSSASLFDAYGRPQGARRERCSRGDSFSSTSSAGRPLPLAKPKSFLGLSWGSAENGRQPASGDRTPSPPPPDGAQQPSPRGILSTTVGSRARVTPTISSPVQASIDEASLPGAIVDAEAGLVPACELPAAGGAGAVSVTRPSQYSVGSVT